MHGNKLRKNYLMKIFKNGIIWQHLYTYIINAVNVENDFNLIIYIYIYLYLKKIKNSDIYKKYVFILLNF